MIQNYSHKYLNIYNYAIIIIYNYIYNQKGMSAQSTNYFFIERSQQHTF